MAEPQEQMLSIVYSSTATKAFSAVDLSALLTTSRRNNGSLDVTGMLLYREGRFLQVLEGPDAPVQDRMTIIRADPRHTNIRILLQDQAGQRQFPDWTMGFEPISPMMAQEVPGYEKTFAENDAKEDSGDTIHALRDLIRWFQERAIPLR